MPFNATPTSILFAQLQASGYDFDSKVYPLDIGDAFDRGHYMIFFINQYKPLKFEDQVVGNPLRGTPVTPFTLTTPSRTRTNQAIVLYIPDEVLFKDSQQWDAKELQTLGFFKTEAQQLAKSFVQNDIDISDMMNNGIKTDEATKLTNTIASSAQQTLLNQLLDRIGSANATLYDLISSTGKFARNNQLEALFQGTGFREFNFRFKFTPSSSEEADSALNIIRTFRRYAAPNLLNNGGTTGRFFEYPAEFEVLFFFNGVENDRLPRIGKCVLRGLSHNYAAAGVFNSFHDGTPVEIDLSLDFMETELITRDKIDRGY